MVYNSVKRSNHSGNRKHICNGWWQRKIFDRNTLGTTNMKTLSWKEKERRRNIITSSLMFEGKSLSKPGENRPFFLCLSLYFHILYFTLTEIWNGKTLSALIWLRELYQSTRGFYTSLVLVLFLASI